MKKVTMFLLAVLLIASLFVSCDTNTNAVLDEHVTVSFSTGSDGRSLVYEIENITDLKWHYSAKKTNQDDVFKFGETNDTTIIDWSDEIELSQGKWNFTLWANKVDESGTEGAKVYEGSSTGVLITRETSPKTIVINVSPEVDNVNGSIKFEGVQVSLKDTNASTPVYAKTATIAGVNGEISLENGTATKSDLIPGDYVVTVKYTEEVDETTVTYASETIVVTVWSGRTTTISGNVSEETGSAIIDGNIQVPTQATVTKTAASGQTTVFTANVAPSNNALSTKMDSTSVSFPAGILDAGEATLQIEANSIDSDFSFNVPESSSTVGSISLKLNGLESSSFGESFVTITTYIAKGLSGVEVKYNGDGYEPGVVIVTTSTDSSTVEGNYYESDTGKLVFSTNHFSEYYVVSNSFDALNVTTNKAYTYFDDALREVVSGDTIKLYSDITGDRFSVTESMTIEGNNHTLTDNATDGRAIWIEDTDVTLTINNLTIDGANKCQRGLQVNYIEDGWINAEIILNKCTIKNVTHYAINLCDRTSVKMEINDSSISGWAAINAYGTGNTITVNNSELIGINDKGYNAAGWNNFATICLEGDTTGQTNLGSSDYQVTINDSTIVAKQTTGNLQRAIGFNSNSKNSTVSLNNTNIVLGDEVKCSFAYDSGIGNKIIIDGDLIYESPEANCWYSNGPFNNQKTGGMVTNLLLPFDGEWLANGEGIILEKSIELSDDITCQMTSGTFYFYLGDYTLTGGSIIINEGVSVISDKEELTVFKASEAGQDIACVDNEDGTYTYSVSNSENSSEETLS